MRTAYDVLGVERTAKRDAIRTAYMRLAKEKHPDKKGGNAAEFARIAEAWSVLRDDVKRNAYDQGLAIQAATMDMTADVVAATVILDLLATFVIKDRKVREAVYAGNRILRNEWAKQREAKGGSNVKR